MMGLKEVIHKPFELLAGEEYPDRRAIALEVSLECDTQSEVNWEVGQRVRDFRHSVIHLDGLRKAVQERRQ